MMESSKQEVVFELPVRVSSKDIVVVPESNITARLFLPKITDPNKKLAVLVYFRGGAFVVNTPSTTRFHNLVTIIVSEANVVAVSVDYRKAPEHDVIVLFLLIIQNQANVVADFQLVFLGGSSSGVDIAHNLAMVAGNPEPGLSIGLLRIALAHPYFWGSVPFGSAIYPDDMVLINQGFVQQVWF
ncbi:hypothetical protein D5086_025516 [Populus alba]|uniref:Uncharacterized protein n=1 Tax=Populus alba TaxID=43335 RepID=A0ACC4B072_POPAL